MNSHAKMKRFFIFLSIISLGVISLVEVGALDKPPEPILYGYFLVFAISTNIAFTILINNSRVAKSILLLGWFFSAIYFLPEVKGQDGYVYSITFFVMLITSCFICRPNHAQMSLVGGVSTPSNRQYHTPNSGGWNKARPSKKRNRNREKSYYDAVDVVVDPGRNFIEHKLDPTRNIHWVDNDL